MFLPNLAPMCLEVSARSAEVYERGQERGLHERRSVSGVIETCKGHAGISVNLALSIKGRAEHVGHYN